MRRRPVLFALALVAASGASTLAQTADPSVFLEQYMTCISQGDYEGALTYCQVPGSPDPTATHQLRDAMGRIAAEVDLPGVVKALSLFVPLSTSPMEWKVKSAPPAGATEAQLVVTATTTLTFDQTVYFVRSGPSWQIDLARTMSENARGTAVGRALDKRGSKAAATVQLQHIGQAMKKYLAEHERRLPRGETWQTELLAYKDILAPADFLSPLEPAGQPAYALNDGVAGRLEHQVTQPERTVLIFDCVPGTIHGGATSLAFRHDGEALALLADGTVVSLKSATDYVWGPNSRPMSGFRSLVQATVAAGAEMVNLREVIEPFGGKVTWDAPSGTTIAEGSGHTVAIRLSDRSVKLDGQPLTLAASPTTIDGKIYVPVSLPSRAFGMSVRWMPNGIEFR